MKYSFDGYNYLIRLDKGERLQESLGTFVQETYLEGAWVSGIGGVLEVELGFFDPDKKEYTYKTFKGVHEIGSLNGNIAITDEGWLRLHLHGVFANEEFKTIAGHVKDFTAAATVELFIHRAYQRTRRKLDKNVGLEILDLE